MASTDDTIDTQLVSDRSSTVHRPFPTGPQAEMTSMADIVRAEMMGLMPSVDVKVHDCVMIEVGGCYVPLTMTESDQECPDPMSLIKVKCQQAMITLRDAYESKSLEMPERDGDDE